MKKALLLLSLFILSLNTINAQTCNIIISSTSPGSVCPGSTVNLQENSSVTFSNQSFDFNNNQMPTGWTTTGGANYGQLCGTGIDNTPYFWASTSGNSVPQITTAAFDVCSGGTIKFAMRYAVQAGSSPCEGPDEPDEGVSLEYSINNGASWVLINYFRPDGQTLTYRDNANSPTISGSTVFTSWANYAIPIPAAAISPNSMFRWIQYNSSGSCCDNWGLDNIFIDAGPCITNVLWSTGETDVTTISPTVNSDTCFIVQVFDQNDQLLCTSDPYCFTVFIPQIEAGPDQTPCENTEITLAASNGTNFTWNNSVTDNVPFNVSYSATPQTYIVNGIDVNGCPATDSLQVTVVANNLPVISYDQPSYCLNGVNPLPTIQGSQNGVFTISPQSTSIDATTGEITLNGQITSPSEQFTINYTSSDYCIGSTSTTVTITTLPSATILSDTTICQHSSNPQLILIGNNATAPYTFSYTINGGATQTVTSNGDTAYITASTAVDGNFTYQLVSVTDGTVNACTNSASNSINVTILPSTMIDVPDNYTIYLGDSTSVTATGSTNLIWSHGIQNGVYFSPTETETYSVTGLNNNGCLSSAEITIFVVPFPYPDPILHIPNVFTPNGDGSNDSWAIDVTYGKEIEVIILNRWGDLMTTLTDFDQRWDGKSKSGNDATESVYFFKYKILGMNDNTLEGHGHVTLIRK